MHLPISLAALLLACAVPVAVAAAAPRCGEYRSGHGQTTLVFESTDTGYRRLDGQEREPLRVDRSGGELRLAYLDDGVVAAIDVSIDGSRLDDHLSTYTLHRAAPCARTTDVARTDCLAHPGQCLAQLVDAPAAQASRACREGVGAGCSALLRAYRDALTAPSGPPSQPSGFELPPDCRIDAAGDSPRACYEATRDALETALQRAAERALSIDTAAQERPLPADQRATLQQLCLQQRGGRFCSEVAEQQWIALQPSLAVQALQVVCDAGRACERVAPLQALGADLRLVPALRVPRGCYQADGGVIDRLDFGDGTPARLHDGAIHLRSGDDALILRPLANGDLLGMDARTGYQHYRQRPAAAQCPPKREGADAP